jgi:hypothetical protein
MLVTINVGTKNKINIEGRKRTLNPNTAGLYITSEI